MKWENRKNNENVKVLVDIKDKIVKQDRWVDGDIFSVDRKYELLELEGKRARILVQVESTWRLKSCTLWVKEWDYNTKKIQHYASFHRNNSYIWYLNNDGGEIIYY